MFKFYQTTKIIKWSNNSSKVNFHKEVTESKMLMIARRSFVKMVSNSAFSDVDN